MNALGLLPSSSTSSFSVKAADEKSMEKKINHGRYKCKNLECPLYLRCHSVRPIKIHWKKFHGDVSNNDHDFCLHRENYKDSDDPCNFLNPCPLVKRETKDEVFKRLKALYYEEKETKEKEWKEKNEKAKKEKEKKKKNLRVFACFFRFLIWISIPFWNFT